MIEKIKKFIGYLTEPSTSRLLLSLKNNGYLKNIGWLNSEITGFPVDKDNNPLPWCTYSYIQFITPYLSKDKKIFEYGAGYSTLYYAPKGIILHDDSEREYCREGILFLQKKDLKRLILGE